MCTIHFNMKFWKYNLEGIVQMRRLEPYLLQHYKGCETQHLRSIRGSFKWFFMRYFSYTSFVVLQFPSGPVGWTVVGWIPHKIEMKTIWIMDEIWQEETSWGRRARERSGTLWKQYSWSGYITRCFQKSPSFHLHPGILSIYYPFHSQFHSLWDKLHIYWS